MKELDLIDYHVRLRVELDGNCQFAFPIVQEILFGSVEDEEDECVGHAEGVLIRHLGSADRAIDCADSVSQDIYDMVTYFVAHGLLEFYPVSRLVAMGWMQIDKAHRGKGLGILAARQLESAFGFCPIVIEPCPLRGESADLTGAELRRAITKLRKYWTKAGFRRFQSSKYYIYVE